jgi:hypothetical protein
VYQRLKAELLSVLPPVVFFFLAVNLINITHALFFHKQHIVVYPELTLLIGAAVVGKVLAVVDLLPIMNVFQGKPLIYTTLWKTSIYSLGALLYVLRRGSHIGQAALLTEARIDGRRTGRRKEKLNGLYRVSCRLRAGKPKLAALLPRQALPLQTVTQASRRVSVRNARTRASSRAAPLRKPAKLTVKRALRGARASRPPYGAVSQNSNGLLSFCNF